MSKYRNLFSQGFIGTCILKNRVIMTAMGTGMGTYDGCVSTQMKAFYAERARGGAGLIIPEMATVSSSNGFGSPGQLSFADDTIIQSAQELCDSVHRYGTKLFFQLSHTGRELPLKNAGGIQPVSASAVPSAMTGVIPREMETEEVYDIIRDFVEAACRVRRSGADGVELHAGHGYLLNQFISPYTNRRRDEFGGTTEDRAKIVVDIIKGIRRRIGSFPIMVRVSVEEFMGDKGLELREGVELCKIFEQAGADAINVTCGIYDTMYTVNESFYRTEGWRDHLAKAVKDAISIPVSGNGLIRHPEYAEKLLESGNQDFIGMARSFLADPEWCMKAEGGMEDEIRYCINCMRCSESRAETGDRADYISCTVNPQMGRELRYLSIKTNGNGRTVVVVGAGPSGMEAARVLSLRRFKVILLEKQDELGGQLRYARIPDSKYRIDWFINYYRKQFELLGTDVRLNVDADLNYIMGLSPYAVILATGGVPIVPGRIEGIQGKNVHTATDVLIGKVSFHDKNIAVIGSGVTGLETAGMLCEAGNQVSVIEMAPKIAGDGFHIIVHDMMEHLEKYGISFYPAHRLTGITDHSVLLDGKTRELSVDEVVLSLGTRSFHPPYEQLKAQIPRLYCTGDASRPGKMYKATAQGFLAANDIA